MVHPGDVAKWFGDVWTGDGSASGRLGALVPGGITQDRANEQKGQPYAVFTVDPVSTELTTGPVYLAAYVVRVGVYADQNTTADRRAVVQRAGLVFNPGTVSRTLREGRVVELLPGDWRTRFEPTLRNGNDVTLCTLAWRVVCEGRRDTA